MRISIFFIRRDTDLKFEWSWIRLTWWFVWLLATCFIYSVGNIFKVKSISLLQMAWHQSICYHYPFLWYACIQIQYVPRDSIYFNSFVYTSGHCRRWRSRMEVKIMAGSLFVHCKIAYFYSAAAEKWLIVSLRNFVTIRRTHFSISCKIFSWIRSTKLKIHAMEFCDFIKDSVSPSGLFVPCSLTVTSTWRPRLTAHCPIGERH